MRQKLIDLDEAGRWHLMNYINRLVNRGLTVAQIAARLKVHKETARNWIKTIQTTGRLWHAGCETEPVLKPPSDVIGIVTMAERVEIYRGRVERGEQLWSAEDATQAIDSHSRRTVVYDGS